MTQTSSDTLDLRHAIAILRRQARLILLTVVVVLALAFIYVTQTTPRFTATALIRVDPQETNLLNPSVASPSNASVESTRIETEVEILKSSSLALQTIKAAELEASAQFGPSLALVDKFRAALGMDLPPPPTGRALVNDVLGKFRDSLAVRRRGLTYLVAVEVTSTDPVQSARVANLHAQTYINDQVAGRVAASIGARDILQAELTKASERLARSNEALRSYVGQNIDRLSVEVGSDQLAGLSSRLKAAAARVVEMEASLAAADGALQQEDWTVLAEAVEDAALGSLDNQRRVLMRQLQGAQQGTDEAVDLETALQQLDAQLRRRADTVVDDLRNGIVEQRVTQEGVLDEIQQTLSGSDLSAQTLADIYGLNQEALVAQRQYDQLINRLRDLEAQAVVQVADSRIVSSALPPTDPSFPNKKLVLSVALVLALMIGVGLALLKEFFYGGVTSSNQLANILPTKVGAVVPKLSGQAGRDSFADKVVTEPMTQFSEAFRKLRASVDLSLHSKAGRGDVILITSSIPAEGKSTTALSLARTYALAGKRTLLIDADLRNPSIHQFVGEEPGMGLLEYLQAEGQNPVTDLSGTKLPQAESQNPSAEEFYVLDSDTGLCIVLGSRRANVPTDAPLQSNAFKDLITNARTVFDIIIVDSAPLVPVVDTQYIAPLVDAAVICVRFGEASQMELRNAYGQLRDTVKETAAVLSVLNFHEGGTHSYRYDGYYGG